MNSYSHTSRLLHLILILHITIVSTIPASASSFTTTETTMSESNTNIDCTAVTEIPLIECQALVALYNSTNGPNWVNYAGDWMQSNTPCSWDRVVCFEGHIYNLYLHSMQMTGEIPAEIGNLSRLNVLELFNNQLSGAIPPEIGNLNLLAVLFLDSNQLVGQIPSSIGRLTNLRNFWLAANQLSGNIPASISNLTNVTNLNLGYNELTASDPGLLAYLSERDSDWNQSQTITPSNFRATPQSSTSILLTWDPIPYTGDGGFYQVAIAPSGGNYEDLGFVTDKRGDRHLVTGLMPDTQYAFIIRTFTPAHGTPNTPEHQQNNLFSDRSEDIFATTFGDDDTQESTPTPVPPTPASTVTPVPPTATPIPPTPTAPPPVTSFNLSVNHLEINQAIQQIQNTVPLVANRPAIARLYVDLHNSNQDVNGVTARLHAMRNGGELPNSPISPFNSNGSFTAPRSADRGRFDHSLNFQLPSDWLNSGGITLWAELNPERTITEGNYDDNRSQAYELNFTDVPPLEVVLIPIAYQKNGQGSIHRPQMDGQNNFGLGIIQQIYPVVNVQYTIHSEYLFRGDLGTSAGWLKLLNEMGELRIRERPSEPNLFGANVLPKYYGVVPQEGSFYGGLAYVSGSTGLGLDFMPAVAAHELGHNFGLLHANCGGPSSVDPNYPYPNGTIANVGMNVYNPPAVIPANHHDVMAYCDTNWISDYHYRRIFTVLTGGTRSRFSRSQNEQQGYLISGQIQSDGTAHLNNARPVDSVNVVLAPGSGPYRIELRDQANTRQFSYDFRPAYTDVHEGIAAPADFAFTAPWVDNLGSIQLWQGDTLLTELQAATAPPSLDATHASGVGGDPNQVAITWSATNNDGGRTDEADEEPPCVTLGYSADGGETWQAVGLDLMDVTSLSLNMEHLPGSENGRVSVIANNSSQFTRVEIQLGQVPDKAPMVGVISSETVRLRPNQPLVVAGAATDLEDGNLTGSRLTWSSPQLGQLGTGSTLSLVEGLDEGSYRIILTATDSAGNSTTDSISVSVTEDEAIYLPLITK